MHLVTWFYLLSEFIPVPFLLSSPPTLDHGEEMLQQSYAFETMEAMLCWCQDNENGCYGCWICFTPSTVLIKDHCELCVKKETNRILIRRLKQVRRYKHRDRKRKLKGRNGLRNREKKIRKRELQPHSSTQRQTIIMTTFGILCPESWCCHLCIIIS